MIGALAVNRSALDPPLGRVADGETVAATKRLDARGSVVETDDGYVVIVGEQTRKRRPLVQWAGALLQIAVGALLCRRGWARFRRIPLDHE